MTGSERAAERVYQSLLNRVGEANPRPRIAPVMRLAELIGSPQLSFPVIHVAGTNGKTSTSRAIESLARAHGLRTGLFTSPHLVDLSERFQLDGVSVSGNVLEEVWEELHVPLQVLDAELAAEGHGPITFFEAIAVLAFAVFADAPVDVAVIEVGMGGEWDATNIADAQVAVFTPIDLDHTEILGADIETIARTKAGIVKPGCSVVTAVQNTSALGEIVRAAERENARLLVSGRDFEVAEDLLAVGGRQVTLRGLHGHQYDPTFLPLYGAHQAQNLSLAIAAIEAFFGAERPIPGEVLAEGLGQLTSPGRLQLIGNDPIVYVDAAHNPHGAQALAQAVTESFAFSELALVTGMMSDKDAKGVLSELLPIADALFLSPIDSPRSMDVEELYQLSGAFDREGLTEVSDSLSVALDAARSWAQQADGRAVLVTGSVLLAGEAILCARNQGWGIV